MRRESRPNVVLVTDQRPLAATIVEVLEMCGCRVTTIAHPFALAGFDEDEPDLVMIDVMLPGMTGYRLAARLRETRFPHTPMIGMSSDSLMLHFAKRSGLFQELLATPFAPEELLECVGRHIGVYVT